MIASLGGYADPHLSYANTQRASSGICVRYSREIELAGGELSTFSTAYPQKSLTHSPPFH